MTTKFYNSIDPSVGDEDLDDETGPWVQTQLDLAMDVDRSAPSVTEALLAAIERDGFWTLHHPNGSRRVVRLPMGDGGHAIAAGLRWPDLVGAFGLASFLLPRREAVVELAHWTGGAALVMLGHAAHHQLSVALWTHRADQMWLLESSSVMADQLRARVGFGSSSRGRIEGRFDVSKQFWLDAPPTAGSS